MHGVGCLLCHTPAERPSRALSLLLHSLAISRVREPNVCVWVERGREESSRAVLPLTVESMRRGGEERRHTTRAAAHTAHESATHDTHVAVRGMCVNNDVTTDFPPSLLFLLSMSVDFLLAAALCGAHASHNTTIHNRNEWGEMIVATCGQMNEGERERYIGFHHSQSLTVFFSFSFSSFSAYTWNVYNTYSTPGEMQQLSVITPIIASIGYGGERCNSTR